MIRTSRPLYLLLLALEKAQRLWLARCYWLKASALVETPLRPQGLVGHCTTQKDTIRQAFLQTRSSHGIVRSA